MTIRRNQSGSSLLIVILTMAAFTTVAIVSSAFFLAGRRVADRIDSSDIAEQMATAAINDGMLRLKNAPAAGVNDGPLVAGEYGAGSQYDATGPDQAGRYSLTPLRRGYLTGTSCQKLGPDQFPSTASNDTACPYYDLTVRTTVALTAPSETVTLPGELFPVNGARQLAIKRIAAGTSLTFTAATRGSIGFQVCERPITSPAGSCFATGVVTANYPASATYTLPPGHTADKLNIILSGGATGATIGLPSGSAGSIAFEKGFTSVEATGYAGGVQKRLILNVFPVNLKYRERDAAQAYDANGCLNDGSAAASVCTP